MENIQFFFCKIFFTKFPFHFKGARKPHLCYKLDINYSERFFFSPSSIKETWVEPQVHLLATFKLRPLSNVGNVM